MQQGSIIQATRKRGPDVWQLRWSEKDGSGRRIYRKRVIGTVRQYPDAQAARDTDGQGALSCCQGPRVHHSGRVLVGNSDKTAFCGPSHT
jgi:hypothetical protein